MVKHLHQWTKWHGLYQCEVCGRTREAWEIEGLWDSREAPKKKRSKVSLWIESIKQEIYTRSHAWKESAPGCWSSKSRDHFILLRLQSWIRRKIAQHRIRRPWKVQ
jgi:hypothetical protein